MTVEGELGEEELPMIEVQEPAATDPLASIDLIRQH